MRLIRSLVVIAALAAPAGAAAAAEQPAPPAGAVPVDATYHSPMRTTCEDELRKDKDWNKLLRDSLRAGVHEEDADLMLRNKTHVQYAYAAMWVLVALFLGFLYRKQVSLRGDITRLEKELEEARKKS
jgi:hypothetical protein